MGFQENLFKRPQKVNNLLLKSGINEQKFDGSSDLPLIVVPYIKLEFLLWVRGPAKLKDINPVKTSPANLIFT